MTDAASWDAYEFPDWVPEILQARIRKFWMPEWGRSPRAWHECATAGYNHHPPLGALVDAESISASGRPILRGRWVPTWNNMGCVVKDDGTYAVSSTCGIRIISAPQPPPDTPT